MAHPKHEEVRQRYDFRCGYCGVSETESGGELTIDHHHPASLGGDDSDTNLVYACFRCNLYKSDFFPTDQDREAGRRLLHPLQDDISTHIRENDETFRLESQTETGRFHIAMLRLNRPQLISLRVQRRIAVLQAQEIELLKQRNDHLHRIIAVQQTMVTLSPPEEPDTE